MKRRDIFKTAVSMCALPAPFAWAAAAPGARVRPGQAGWPSATDWDGLKSAVGGRLLKLGPAFESAPAEAMAALKNSFMIGDHPALTQTSGWVDAWSSRPSAYAVRARGAADVAAAVHFARTHNLRLVVKGGGHSYQGTSDAPDSLLVWTRDMNSVRVHDYAGQPAVSLGAGAMWIDAYHAVTTQAGRYVQGGGCTTVGVAGLVQSGGFGSFSKRFGSAAGGLLEAEVVTADGEVRIANANSHPELFWALKGGGGGSLGVVTRVTLRTHELPAVFGAVFCRIVSANDDAQRDLIDRFLEFYSMSLFNPSWGEQVEFHHDALRVSMVFQGMGKEEAAAEWTPFLEWVRSNGDYRFEQEFQAIALPARHFWDGQFFKKNAPGFMVADPRADAPEHHVLWRGDLDQAGWFIHGYKSAWLPASLLDTGKLAALADAVFRATRHWSVGFHFNKGLAGAPADALARSRETAMNPGALDAFALAIIAGGGKPRYPGMPGPHQPIEEARGDAHKLGLAMDELMKAAPGAGAYVSESDYFQRDWQQAFWGANYARLLAAKKRYDPEGLFFVRHGVGSEGWTEDGFRRL